MATFKSARNLLKRKKKNKKKIKIFVSKINFKNRGRPLRGIFCNCSSSSLFQMALMKMMMMRIDYIYIRLIAFSKRIRFVELHSIDLSLSLNLRLPLFCPLKNT
jgi:hypothetical protein